MSTKKDAERTYLDQFLKAQGLASGGDVVPQEPPGPDFVIRAAEGFLLGIEITGIAADEGERARGGSSLREDESLGVQWLRTLADLHYARCGSPASVKLSLNRADAARDPALTPALLERLAEATRCSADRLEPWVTAERLGLLNPPHSGRPSSLPRWRGS